jgi:hypothetical protein
MSFVSNKKGPRDMVAFQKKRKALKGYKEKKADLLISPVTVPWNSEGTLTSTFITGSSITGLAAE